MLVSLDFYLAMLLVLAALILRPVGFKFRSKMPGTRWCANWDWALFVGGLVPTLVFGVAMGNLLEGVPFSFDSEPRATYTFGLFISSTKQPDRLGRLEQPYDARLHPHRRDHLSADHSG